MTPHTEPNSLPPLFTDWLDWREAYAAYVERFKTSPKTFSDGLLLELHLKLLGFAGSRLASEMTYIRENT